ncbi:MAG: hypothetical protein IJ002_08460 [Clostridia bacterium]|nr:hypothetical protein [Clostridia bacterium]
MLYRIGTLEGIAKVSFLFPIEITEKLTECITILDDAYGTDRDYLHIGGYALLAQTREDFSAIQDITKNPYEWIIQLHDYLCILYLLGDDFSVVLFLPTAVAPDNIKKHLQGEKL